MRRASLAVLLSLTVAVMVVPQEHPEHPAQKPAEVKKQESTYSMDELEKAITAEIETAQKKNGGWYLLKDKTAKKTWKLKLDRVHRERLSRINPKTYFACTDFKSSDGHTVDVDFFMKDKGKKLVMTDATVHKVDGKPRYNWKEKDGFWSRVPV